MMFLPVVLLIVSLIGSWFVYVYAFVPKTTRFALDLLTNHPNMWKVLEGAKSHSIDIWCEAYKIQIYFVKECWNESFYLKIAGREYEVGEYKYRLRHKVESFIEEQKVKESQKHAQNYHLES